MLTNLQHNDKENNMNYDNFTSTSNDVCPVNKNDIPLSAMLDEASALSDIIFEQVHKINGHMFAPEADVCHDHKSPSCFREALGIHISTLKCIAEGIASLAQQVGV